MTIEFITTNYEFSHGRKPRGNGGWVFDIEAEWPGLSGPDATAKHTVHRSCASEHSLHVKSKSVNT